ncbi:MAG: hypothetical protein K2W82_16765 [Candidatus Obscuribacterales bacterium]|nr:hypothetical protein [Candidatus Obscuribacterales bacterium]
MEIYSVGLHELSEEYVREAVETDHYTWMVYEYEEADRDSKYSGCGGGLLLGTDGEIYQLDLNHYRDEQPFDLWKTEWPYAVNVEGLRTYLHHHKKVAGKVISLLPDAWRRCLSAHPFVSDLVKNRLIGYWNWSWRWN